MRQRNQTFFFFYDFCFSRPIKRLQCLSKIRLRVCVSAVHTVSTHLCKLVQVPCASTPAHGCISSFQRMCVCARVCLVCLCEFCKLFTALAVSLHCWWQWKVCLIVVVLQWKFNSAPFHCKNLPWSLSHHTHMPLGVRLWRHEEQLHSFLANTKSSLEWYKENLVMCVRFDKWGGEQVNYGPQPTLLDLWP